MYTKTILQWTLFETISSLIINEDNWKKEEIQKKTNYENVEMLIQKWEMNNFNNNNYPRTVQKLFEDQLFQIELGSVNNSKQNVSKRKLIQ